MQGYKPVKPIVALAATILALAVATADEPPNKATDNAREKKAPSIGYPTVVDALLGVQKSMEAQSRMERGWTIVDTREKNIPVQWFFTHKGHPAHPAAIKRTMTWKDNAWDIDMAMLCEGPRPACDKLAEEFRRINERLEKSWSKR